MTSSAYWRMAFIGVALLLVGAAFSQTSASGLLPGVVAEVVEKGLAADKSGISEGDVLVSWHRGTSEGDITSPFVLAEIEVDQRPRGDVTIEGIHQGQRRLWTLTRASWGLRARPNFADDATLHTYLRSAELSRTGQPLQAADYYRESAQEASSWVKTWLLLRAAELLGEAQQWKESDDVFAETAYSAPNAGATAALIRVAWGDTFQQRSLRAEAETRYLAALKVSSVPEANLIQGLALRRLAELAWRHWDLAGTEKYSRDALAVQEKLAAGSLENAEVLNQLGNLENRRGHLAAAEDYQQRALLMSQRVDPESLETAGSLYGLGNTANDRGDLAKAETYLEQALAIQKKRFPQSLAVATTLEWLGFVSRTRGDEAKMESLFNQALAIQQAVAPGSLEVAFNLLQQGGAAYVHTDYDQAKTYLSQALSITQKLAPRSLLAGSILVALGSLALPHGDVLEAESDFREALSITEQEAPGSLYLVAPLRRLGRLALDRGDLETAEKNFTESLAIVTKLVPDSTVPASELKMLGNIALQRGNLALAEGYYRHALQILEKPAPEGSDIAEVFTLLGGIAHSRGDLPDAERCYSKAVAIYQKRDPNSYLTAQALSSLGSLWRERGDLAQAESYFQRSLQINRKIGPEGLPTSSNLNDLGNVALDRGDLAQAETYQRQALAIQEKQAPRGTRLADTLGSLGEIFFRRGDWNQAGEYQQRALAIWEKVSPLSMGRTRTLAALAEIALGKQQMQEATLLYEQAIHGLESQSERLGGGDETRAGFRANHENYYERYIDLLVQQKKLEQAFAAVEHSRARTLLEILQTGQVDVRKDADPELLQQARSLQQNLITKSNRRIHLLSTRHSEAEMEALDAEIAQLLSQKQEIEGQLRFESPEYAALTQPRLLEAREVQEQLLDANTLLLEYSLGEKCSYLFVLGAHSLAAYTLPGRDSIEVAARRFYGLISKQKRTPQAHSDYLNAAAHLSRMIVGPAAAELKNNRLLIVTDGALGYIPFSALPATVLPAAMTSNRRQSVPLVAAHEVVNLPSASVLSVLRQQQASRKPPTKVVAVFADPVFAREDPRVKPEMHVASAKTESRGESTSRSFPDEALFRSADDVGLTDQRGLHLPRLRYSRQEADTILAATPAGQGRRAVDFKASRDAVVNGDMGNYRILHFATHGLLDNRHPELSGLVLSLVDRNGRSKDGFLSLEDIYNLKLSADLVVLSACQSALGKEIAGEGLLGLTRGFMYAGASRVVASLWQVSDEATAVLMGHFYRAMSKGLNPAAALRAAQLQMRKEARWDNPYYWAGFQIQGEWK